MIQIKYPFTILYDRSCVRPDQFISNKIVQQVVLDERALDLALLPLSIYCTMRLPLCGCHLVGHNDKARTASSRILTKLGQSDALLHASSICLANNVQWNWKCGEARLFEVSACVRNRIELHTHTDCVLLECVLYHMLLYGGENKRKTIIVLMYGWRAWRTLFINKRSTIYVTLIIINSNAKLCRRCLQTLAACLF